ncbi:Regulatory protein RecX [subsurface metagenome]
MMKINQITPKQALARIQKICSAQEKCSFDVRRKLFDWGFENMAIEKIINSLIEDKFVDDNRFAKSFVREKFRFNNWGRIKIAYALKQKRIPESTINLALEEIEEEQYLHVLETELIKKKKSIKTKNQFDLKGKLLRFGQSKGFETEYILRIIERLIRNP